MHDLHAMMWRLVAKASIHEIGGVSNVKALPCKTNGATVVVPILLVLKQANLSVRCLGLKINKSHGALTSKEA